MCLICALPFVSNCSLVIAGNNEEQIQPRLEALGKQEGVHKRISFVGPIYGLDNRGILRRTAALVLASYSGNFGNVF